MGLAAGQLKYLRSSDPGAAGRLLAAADAALAAVEPARLVRRALARRRGGIRVGGAFLAAEGVAVLAFGKAAVGMSRGADQSLGPLISRGLAVSGEAGEAPGWAELIVAGHPIPDRESVRAGRAALSLAESTGPDEVLLCLVSGGGSALLEMPAEGLDLDDLRYLNDRLIRSGAPIEAVNRVRRVASQVKGGKLAARCPGRTVTLVISDVGRDPAVVASGPTVTSSAASGESSASGKEAAGVLDRFGVDGRAADHIRRLEQTRPPRLSRPADGGQAPADPALVLADCFTAGRAAVRFLSEAGLEAELRPVPLTGRTTDAVRRALAAAPEGRVQVLVGETAVEVAGGGRGGRNQHAALAAALEIAGGPHRFLAFGTDGIDGPTDAAGGLVDGGTVTRPGPARRALEACDSYPCLEAAGGLLRTGSTGTNAADLWIIDKTG